MSCRRGSVIPTRGYGMVCVMSQLEDREMSANQTGLTSQEAREFHSAFMTWTLAYIAVAVVAHVLVWNWRPWF